MFTINWLIFYFNPIILKRIIYIPCETNDKLLVKLF